MNCTRTEVVTPPDYEVGSVLSATKELARTTHSFEDQLISRLIRVAVQHLEETLGRKLLTQTLRSWYQGFDDRTSWWDGTIQVSQSAIYSPEIKLPYLPVASVVAIKTYSDADVETTVDPTTYRTANQDKDMWTVIKLIEGATWPSDLRNLNSLSVEYIVGHADTLSTLPENLQYAISAMAAHMYQFGCDPATAACCIESYVDKYRVLRL